ncbi:transcriptional regulator GcvA [Temperatibacter marinus]|uniref:Transcriptional regulator GcvA n=1 Tax=Temperatibacter marinus TaxID=1456591 RepID=A0AA52H9D4_9PROT|nr:transcriptional regulator GcvA [Temperatibacter marinus]WND01523.1 transcriptional regulator GcvA [Temperatibacter marinus]
MKRSLLPLNALRAFDAAARNLSFKEAANELSVTPAAISQQIRSLEEVLGVELFKRTSRALLLTEQAQLALPALQEAFSKIEQAVETIQAAQETNELKISVSHSFASKWLVPRLASYYETHPDSIVRIDASLSLTDFRSEDVDLAIRYGAGNYEGLYEEEILKETIFPVCSPEIADQIKSPEDLMKFTLIHDDSFNEDFSAPSWAMWLKATGIEGHSGHSALHLNTNFMAVDAAMSGRGVALARSAIAEEDIKAGRLVRPLSHDTPVNFAHYIVCPETHLQRPQVQKFIDWLRIEVKRS